MIDLSSLMEDGEGLRMKRYTVTLEQAEREELKGITRKGAHRSLKVINALVLLNCDEGAFNERRCTGDAIAGVLRISLRRVDRVKKRFVEAGLEVALGGRQGRRPTYRRKADGEFEARLIAFELRRTAGGPGAVVAAVIGGSGGATRLHRQRVARNRASGFKKNELKPWKRVGWVIPPQGNGHFAAAMEQVLDVYRRAYDPAYPVVCMDETPRQLIRATRVPIPARPGQPARHDYEYRRCGVCNVFMATEPLAGTRLTKVTERKTKIDWAHFLADIAAHYTHARKITLVMDNLSTHRPGALYEAFPPVQAKALWDRFEFVHTPKHGSWLNVAEVELNVMIRQCLNRRIDSIDVLRDEVAAWQASRDRLRATVDWQFTTDDARVKLKRLYPTFDT